MATYQVDAPDGHTYTIDGPDGADDATIAAAVLAQYPDSDKPPPPPPPPQGLPGHAKAVADLAANNAKMRAANPGTPVVPGPPPPQDRLERVGGNLLSGIKDAGIKVFGGLQEAAGYIPEGQKPTQIAGYDMPNVVSGGANVIAGLGRGIGALGGAALDSAGIAVTPGAVRPDTPLVSEAIGENIVSPAMEGIKYLSGSETPGKDFADFTKTDPRYYEALANFAATPVGGRVIGAAAKSVGGVGKAINAAIPTRMSHAEARAKHFYSIPDVVYDPSVASTLQADVDTLLAKFNPSTAAEGEVRKTLQRLQNDIASGTKPLTQDVFAEFRDNIKAAKGEMGVNPDKDFRILNEIEKRINKDILYNPSAPAVSGDAVRSAIARKNGDIRYAQVAKMKTAIENKISDYVNKNAIFDGADIKGDYKDQLTRQALSAKKLKSADAKIIVPKAQTKAAGRVVLGTKTGNTLQLISRLGEAVPASMLSALATLAAISGRPELIAAAGGVFAGAKAAGGLSTLSKARQFRRYEKEVLRNKETPLPARQAAPPPPTGAAPPPPTGAAPPPNVPGPAATPPGPMPTSRQLPQPGNLTPRAVTAENLAQMALAGGASKAQAASMIRASKYAADVARDALVLVAKSTAPERAAATKKTAKSRNALNAKSMGVIKDEK